MAISSETALTNLVRLLDPAGKGSAQGSGEVDLNRFAMMILLCTHAEVFAKAYPSDREVNPQAITNLLPEISEDVVRMMLPYRSTFAAAQLAWFKLSDEYEDPPCPEETTFKAVIDLLQSIR